jgi:hypothetical protein
MHRDQAVTPGDGAGYFGNRRVGQWPATQVNGRHAELEREAGTDVLLADDTRLQQDAALGRPPVRAIGVMPAEPADCCTSNACTCVLR